MVDTIPKEVLVELKETFSYFEKVKGEGVISNKYLGAALRAMGLNPTETMLKGICDETDSDGSGNIKLSTFLLLAYGMQAKNTDGEQEIRDAFKFYGKDNSLNNTSMVHGSSRPLSPNLDATAGSFAFNNANNSFTNPNSSFRGGMPPVQPPLVMSMDDLRTALMGNGEPFSEEEWDHLMRELDLMPGDDVTIDDIIRIVALNGVERQEAAAQNRRRARTVHRGGSASAGIGGGASGGSPTNRPSRAVSVADRADMADVGSLGAVGGGGALDSVIAETPLRGGGADSSAAGSPEASVSPATDV